MTRRVQMPFSTILVLYESIGGGRYRPVLRQYAPFGTEPRNLGMTDTLTDRDMLPIFNCVDSNQDRVVVTGMTIAAVGDPYSPDRLETDGVSREGFTPTALDSCGGMALRSFIASADARWSQTRLCEWPTTAIGNKCAIVFAEPEDMYVVWASRMTINVIPTRSFQVDMSGSDVPLVAQAIRIELVIDDGSLIPVDT